jgi:hypothetical protein
LLFEPIHLGVFARPLVRRRVPHSFSEVGCLLIDNCELTFLGVFRIQTIGDERPTFAGTKIEMTLGVSGANANLSVTNSDQKSLVADPDYNLPRLLW